VALWGSPATLLSDHESCAIKAERGLSYKAFFSAAQKIKVKIEKCSIPECVSFRLLFLSPVQLNEINRM
jgi:hypothetical protein